MCTPAHRLTKPVSAASWTQHARLTHTCARSRATRCVPEGTRLCLCTDVCTRPGPQRGSDPVSRGPVLPRARVCRLPHRGPGRVCSGSWPTQDGSGGQAETRTQLTLPAHTLPGSPALLQSSASGQLQLSTLSILAQRSVLLTSSFRTALNQVCQGGRGEGQGPA